MGTLSMPIDEAAETPKCSPGTSNTVSPFDIFPVPNIKKRTTTRGREATRSSLITGSPYKEQLTKSLKKSAPKKTDNDINLDINDGDKPDSSEATCVFCDGKFCEDTRGEGWVKCVMCQMWAHLDCAGAETASYVCDFCK
ncbi:hypothetical protein AVEN_128814-1 [Araneus ventricosus]|uniref:Zinc finger PHD-type domain-containing protein n=1 Tax=Araneus ventricosus TaxID=182803 RepID=A0A4Y2K3L8_ARAVE|nr:hypothetical protein AVEN_128814-1 [Araneus ventricosus]